MHPMYLLRYSPDENLDDGIFISEKSLNEFNTQIILEKTDVESPMTLETIFRNRQWRIIRRSLLNEQIITELF